MTKGRRRGDGGTTEGRRGGDGEATEGRPGGGGEGMVVGKSIVTPSLMVYHICDALTGGTFAPAGPKS